MPLNAFRYELDPTGVNPDNLIVGEIHTLSTLQIRAIAPVEAPFFTNRLQVYDHNTGALLNRGTHYQCVELSEEATLRFGKEICSVILIIDPAVSGDVRLNYQTLGGLFTNKSEAIANFYENVIKDDRPVHWVNVLNKPTEYPPTLHRHLLDDLYGFEAIVVALERIRNAIILSDVPAYEALLDYFNKSQAVMTEKEALSLSPMNKLIGYDNLLIMMSKTWSLSEFKIVNVPEVMFEGGYYTFEVRVRDGAIVPNGTQLYWSIIHKGTGNDDFSESDGYVTITDGVGYFNLTVLNDLDIENQETIHLTLKANSVTTELLYISPTVFINNTTPLDENMYWWQFYSPPTTGGLLQTQVEPFKYTPSVMYMVSDKDNQQQLQAAVHF